MSISKKYLEVAVAAPIFHTLTYKSPADNTPSSGCRVLVPLGRRKVTGYVLEVMARHDSEHRIKEVIEVLDNAPLFPDTLIDLFRWTADYYHHPLGEVIKAALPSGLTSASSRELLLTENGAEE